MWPIALSNYYLGIQVNAKVEVFCGGHKFEIYIFLVLTFTLRLLKYKVSPYAPS